MKLAKKSVNVFLAFVLAFGLCPVVPSSALAVDDDAARGDLVAGSNALLGAGDEGPALSGQAEGDIEAGTWGDLQNAINSVENGKMIVLVADVTAGPDDGKLAVQRDGVSFAIDLAGHTINRNLTSRDDDNNGHVFDVNQGTLTIKDSSAEQTGKITGGYDENGGGIVIGGNGHLVIESGTVTGNQADNGGGIFVYGTLTMTGGSVSGNTGGDCGGIYNHGGTIDLTNATISNNKTNAGGAGVNNKGTATLENCTISGNVADSEGGGVYNGEDGTITLEGCEISGNKSKSGGGMSSHGKATLTNTTTLSGNISNEDGGAICSYGTTELSGCTFGGNESGKSGGAIRVHGGTVRVASTTISKNKANDRGGAIYVNNGGTLDLADATTITENTGMNGGGGIWVADGTDAVKVAGKIIVTDNKANDVCLNGDKKLTVSNALSDDTRISVLLAGTSGTITSGFSEKHPGADPETYFQSEPGFSVLLDATGEAMVVASDWAHLQKQIDAAENGSTITLDKDWKAASQNTALRIASGKVLTIDLNGHKLNRNLGDAKSAVADGGVIIVEGTLTVKDGTGTGEITGGYSDAGGGIRVKPGATCTVEGGFVRGNRATAGGGIYNEGTLAITAATAGTESAIRGIVEQNTADSDGGGIYSTGDATSTTIAGGAISLNTANNGGGVYVGGGTTELAGKAHINFNTANKTGGGIYLSAGTLNLFDCNVDFNRAAEEGGGIWNCDNGTLNVKGAPIVGSNNAIIGNNILLGENAERTIKVVDRLADTAKLDVVTKNTSTYAVTSGLDGKSATPKGTIDNFSYGRSGTDELEIKDDGELYHKQTPADVSVSTWKELQAALNNENYHTIALSANIAAEADDVCLSVKRTVTIDLNGKTIDRNLGDYEHGQVMSMEGGGEVTIKDSLGTGVITGGRYGTGGGIYIGAGSTLYFEGGSIEHNSGEFGGGIYNEGTLVLRGGQIAYNTASRVGGGVYNYGLAEMEATGGAIKDNKSGGDGSGDGGGIYTARSYYDKPKITLSGLLISGNTADGAGGGLCLIEVREASITGCAIVNNTANGVAGGINFEEKDVTLTITDTVINGNTAVHGDPLLYKEWAIGAGGIGLYGGSINMTGGSLSYNTATQGGGLILSRYTQFTADQVRMQGNKAIGGGGGAIQNVEGRATVKNSEISGNEATEDGGAIYAYHGNETNTTLERCNIFGNVAHGNGGAICCDNGNLATTECTMTGNVAGERGGAVYANVAGPSFNGATITGNSAGLEIGGVYVDMGMSIQGKVIMKDNGGDLYLSGLSGKMQYLHVGGNLAGSSIGVIGEYENGLITEGFQQYNPGVDPADIFFAKTGYSVVEEGGEAKLVKSEWPQLQKKIRDTEDGGTLVLERDWKAIDQDSQLKIPEGKTITIDLNGHTVNRNRTSSDANGHVIEVTAGATLNIKDSSANANGKICGGYGENGGGIVVQEGATCNIQSGNIADNRAVNGGGVYVSGTLNVTGGVIEGNRADNGGGIYSAGTTSVTGGTIVSNEAAVSAGGIGFAAGSTLSVGGSPSVTGNDSPAGKNILVGKDEAITVASNLDSAALLDVAAQDVDKPLTSGLSGKGELANFTYNGKGRDNLEIGQDGELYFKKDAVDVWVSDWQALQNAINDGQNQGKVIGLQNDITASEDDSRLLLSGKNVTIVLNGRKLDRHLDKSDEDGHVFELSDNSTLTIRDSAGTGTITGGYAKHGGAINIHEGSTCTIEGGTVSGNRASKSGGGIFVYGTLVMTGGYISKNEGEDCGGIYVHENGSASLENVVLANNTASEHGGGAINNKGTATLKSCEIRDNHADAEGGGLYNGNKDMTLTDCTVSGNSAPYGGGICGFGTVTLTNTVVANNRSDERGGGVFAHKTFNMTGGAIKDNTASDCGGIFIDEEGVVMLDGVDVSGNRATEDGGAGVNNNGKATLTKCTINNNKGNADGGAVYTSSESETTFTDCTISGNSAGWDGGAICSYGTVTLENTPIVSNKAKHSGAGMLVHAGKVTLKDAVVRNNEAKGLGGGVYVNDDATVSIVGGTIASNSAFEGGGIWVSGGANALTMEGLVVVSDNEGGSDVHLLAGKKIKLSAVLHKGTKIGVFQEDDPGVPFTEGYAAKNPTVDPFEYFFSNEGYEVHKEGEEAIMKLRAPEESPFIEMNSQVVRDYTQLNGRNWMAGISGERRLNEINMPGTHDSGTASVEGNISTGKLSTYAGLAGAVIGLSIGGLVGGVFGGIDLPIEVSKFFQKFANCQTEYIDEQLADGVRSLDIRLNTYYAKQGYPVKKHNDGENLYLLHGKDPNAGSYFCKDRDGNFLTFKEVLGWIKDFLREHPTETIIMGVQIDSVDDVYDEGMERIRAHLRDLSMEINPSTGESYLYMEDGVFGQKYSAYPQLKDCRGKIVLSTSDADAELIGGLVTGVGLREVARPEGSYKDNANNKIINLTNFYGYYGGRDLPTNLDTSIDYYYSVGTNGTDTRIPPQDTPLDIADDVLEVLFGQNGILLNREGTYLGLVNMDAANARNCKLVWSTNFFEGLEYCTVTAKSGLIDADTKTYTVLKGTPITIPDCIYDVAGSTDTYFEGWRMSKDKGGDSSDFQPGSTFIVNEDVTFTAQWSNTARTTIRVVWMDGKNKDSLRPDSLKLTVDGQEVEVKKEDNWRHVVAGRAESVAPVMEGDWGGQYTSSVTSLPLAGYVVTLTHTPATKTKVAGSILWKDDDNKGGKRPDKVSLNLFADGKYWGSQEVTASSDWKFDFGEQPEYENGIMINYRIEEEAIDGYATTVTSYIVTNIAHKASRQPTGFVIWADEDDAAKRRPASVKVNLLKDGAVIDSTTVSENSSGEWPFYFDMGDDDSAYTITCDALENYETAIRKDGVEHGVTYVIHTGEVHTHSPTEMTVVTKEATCDKAGSRKVVEYCPDCYAKLSERVEEVPALGHDWGRWKTLKEPSKTEPGMEMRMCAHNPLHMQTRTIPVTDHVHGLVHVDAKAATCTGDGNIEHWKCTEGEKPCSLCFKDADATEWVHEEGIVLHAFGHDWNDATYKWNGDYSKLTATRTCKHDASHVQIETVAATKLVIKPATCTDAGLAKVILQSFKGEGFAPQTKELQLPALGHEWSAWKTTKKPTCTDKGVQTRTCKHDATHVETRSVAAFGHEWSAWKTTKKPTCTDKGVQTRTCKHDATHVETRSVAAFGHDWGAWKVVKKPTALNAGVKQRVCKHDPKHVQKKSIKPTGVSGSLLAKMSTNADGKLTFTWSKVKGAEGYDIFFSPCNTAKKKHAPKRVKTLKGNKVLSWTKTGLKKGASYKMRVKAWAKKGGKKKYVKKSNFFHGYIGGYSKTRTNAKKVVVAKSKISLRVGKTFKIKASVVKLKKGKKLISEKHAAKLRYKTTNRKVAIVSKSGKVRAKAKGTCKIYVYAANGVQKAVKVTVR